MNKFMLASGQSAFKVLSSTVIILPFMFFLKISSEHTVMSVLPFVIFYTLRTTGIFFIRGIKTSLNSASLVKVALYCGTLGAAFGILGSVAPAMYIVAGFFLGLSAAWLPTAQTAINIFREKNHLVLAKSKAVTLLTLLIIGYILAIPTEQALPLFFACYTVLYLMALATLASLRQYQVTSHDLEDYSYRYLILFALFFILIFYLRASRLLMNIVQFDYVIWGALCLALILIVSKIWRHRTPQRKVPYLISYLSLINGAIGNYLFLFASLYVAGYYGHTQLVSRFYLPYVLGIFIAPVINQLLAKKDNYNLFILLFVSLLMMLVNPIFSLGILTLSVTKGCLNLRLNHIYMAQNQLPEDKRIWVKNTIQSTGSIIYQIIIMISGSFIVVEHHDAIRQLLVVTSQQFPSDYSRTLMVSWNHVATTILLIMVLIYYILAWRQHRTKTN